MMTYYKIKMKPSNIVDKIAEKIKRTETKSMEGFLLGKIKRDFHLNNWEYKALRGVLEHDGYKVIKTGYGYVAYVEK